MFRVKKRLLTSAAVPFSSNATLDNISSGSLSTSYVYTGVNGGNFSFSFQGSAGSTVFVDFYGSSAANLPTITYNGVTMTQLGTSTGNGWTLYRYYLLNAGTGKSQNVAVTVTSGLNWYSAYAFSIKNLDSVSQIGSMQTATDTGTSLSQTVTASAGDLILHNFSSTGPPSSSYWTGTATDNGTNVFAVNYYPGPSNFNISTQGTTTFTATQTNSGWVGAATVISPTGSSPVSVFPTPRIENVATFVSVYTSGSLQFTAHPGADIFLDITGYGTTPTYNGVTMTTIATGTTTSSSGTYKFGRFRAAGAGTGKPQTLSLGTSGGWIGGNAYSVIGVNNVDAAQTTSGSGALSQTVTASNGLVLQMFGGAVYGLNGQMFSNFSGGRLVGVTGGYSATISTSSADGSLGNRTFTATTSYGLNWLGIANILT